MMHKIDIHLFLVSEDLGRIGIAPKLYGQLFSKMQGLILTVWRRFAEVYRQVVCLVLMQI
jgi:hypothetical protein